MVDKKETVTFFREIEGGPCKNLIAVDSSTISTGKANS
jgi:hypothetical protein